LTISLIIIQYTPHTQATGIFKTAQLGISHQKFLNKKKKGKLAEARHARRELTEKILVRHFTKIPKILTGVGAGVWEEGEEFSFLLAASDGRS